MEVEHDINYVNDIILIIYRANYSKIFLILATKISA
jgi:hypothetical protein